MLGTLQPRHVKLLFKNWKPHPNLKEAETTYKISVKKFTVLFITEVSINFRVFQHHHFTSINMSRIIKAIGSKSYEYCITAHSLWFVSIKFKSTGIIDVHSTKLCISSTRASHSTITHNYFSNTVLHVYTRIQNTQRSAFMQVLKSHKQNTAQGLHKVKLKDSP
jgi:hypothetical protein